MIRKRNLNLSDQKIKKEISNLLNFNVRHGKKAISINATQMTNNFLGKL